MDSKEKRYIFDDPKNVKRLIVATYAICGVLFALDFVIHRHVLSSWEGWYGFYGIFGFVSFVGLVLLAKELRKLVMRKEEYYDE